MRLRRVEITDFKKIGKLVIGDLDDGLNVVVGDNEAGKSTLLEALRAVLFERHRIGGEAAAAMLPYGQAVRPEIALDFELGGETWRLRKAFCQRQEAELTGAGERHTGDAVEERLAELLGFTPPGRGASRPREHQGVYGLLWVEQGAAHRELGVGAGHGTLASALEAEVGQVLGGERGRALLAAAEARRNSFWDRREQPKPKGDFRLLLDGVEALAEEKRALEAKLAAHDEKVQALGRAREILARHERDGALQRAAGSAAEARAALLAIGELRAKVELAADRRSRAATRREIAEERRRLRGGLWLRVAQARTALAEAQEAAEAAGAALGRLRGIAEAASERLSQARDRSRGAQERRAGLERADARRQALDALTRLEERLAAAEAAATRRREALGLAAATAIDADLVARLERLQGEVERARMQLETASVRIAFAPERARAVELGGRPHDPGQPLVLSADATLTLEGFGRLSISPGGGTGALRARTEEAERALGEALRGAGVASLAEARAALQRRLDQAREAELQKRLVESHAPRGLDALRGELERTRALLDGAPPGPEVPAEGLLDEARRAERDAASAERAAEADAEAARQAREAADREAAVLGERASAAARELDARARELEAARAQIPDERLADELAAASADLDQATLEERTAREVLDRADPEAAELALRRSERAEQEIRRDIEATAQAARDLEVELRALGRDGLGEQLAEIEGRLAAQERQARAKRLEAEASRLLHDTLTAAQAESKDRWLGPVRAGVAPFLRLLQPESEIVLDERTLEIEGLLRRGVQERFDALSIGAREQVAVITRLALAEILRGSGKPSVVILDDALVNTDEARLERMHLVLQKASRSLQILVLTCRERDFVQLGAPIRRI